MYQKEQQDFINSLAFYQWRLIDAMRDRDNPQFSRVMQKLEHAIKQYNARTALPVIVGSFDDDEL